MAAALVGDAPPAPRRFGDENPLGWPFFEQFGVARQPKRPYGRSYDAGIAALARAKAKRARKGAIRIDAVKRTRVGAAIASADIAVFGDRTRKLTSAAKRRWWTR